MNDESREGLRKNTTSYARSLIEASLDPLVTIGLDGRITDVNAATEAVTGRGREVLIGTDFSDYFTEPERARAGYRQAFREGFVRDYRLDIRHSDGHITPVLYNASLYRNEAGEVAGLFAAARDITERRRAEEAIRKSEARLNQAQRIAHIGSWELDLVNNVLEWSDEIYRIFEIDKARFGASYQAFLDLIHPEDRAAVDAAYTHSVESRTPYSIDHRLLFPDGRVKHVHEQCETFYDEAGRPLRSLGTVQDISERKRAEQALRQLNLELERRVEARTAALAEANRELEGFAYSVSHDLRMPLRALDGFSKILLQDYSDRLDDEGRRLLGIVRESAQRMGQLISDILILSRTGRAELTPAEVDMAKLVREVWEEIEGANPGRRMELRLGDLPPAQGDRGLLRQVFANLLANAAKFTRPRETAVIEVGAEAAGAEVVYHVRDNGVGFNPRYAGKLFGVFQRLHTTEEFEGTGIGLALVKRIVTRHGGRVWAESAVDEGATFWFALPRDPEALAKHRTAPQGES